MRYWAGSLCFRWGMQKTGTVKTTDTVAGAHPGWVLSYAGAKAGQDTVETEQVMWQLWRRSIPTDRY